MNSRWPPAAMQEPATDRELKELESVEDQYTVPADIRAIFDKALAVFPHGLIAGGAVRDAVLGKEIADIDIIVPVPTRPTLHNPYWDPVRRYDTPSDSDSGEELANQNWVVRSTVVERPWSPYPINLLYVEDQEPDEDPSTYLERFDYGLCMIGYTANGLHLTPAFVKDARKHQLTLVGPGADYTSPARYEKLAEKFEGWKIENPSGNVPLDFCADDPDI